jgi:glucose/mannose transport system permease protein
MTSNPVAWPSEVTGEGYASALEQLAGPLVNSLIITLFGATGSVFLGSLCAYALSKWRFKGSNAFFILLVAATYLPYQAILIPLLQTINALNLYDNLLGLILVHSIFGMPMCTVMMRGYYADVPDVLIRQAMSDGNGPWQIYRKIVLPSTKIATITVFVFQCTSIWNEMLFALVLGGYDSKPATIALNELAGTMAAEFNVQMAGSMLLAFPVLILYIFMGKYLIRGYMAGAVTAS